MKKSNKHTSVPTLILAVNEDCFFLSHRLDIALAAQEAGWRVVITCADTGLAGRIRSYGFIFESLPITPRSLNPLKEWRVVSALMRLMRKYPGAIMHFVGMKLILSGNLASRLVSSPRGIVNAVSGLGVLFINPNGRLQQSLFRLLRLFKNSNIPSRTIFQNADDQRLFSNAGLLEGSESVYIKGSGVNLNEYYPLDFNDTDKPHIKNSDKLSLLRSRLSFKNNARPAVDKKKLTVLFAGRLLRSKGVEDFIQAAELLRAKWNGLAEFHICGALSTNIDSISEEEMNLMTDGSFIRWFGYRNDMPNVVRSADIMAYPSYYREGVPRILLEASASGLPLVTCDSVGCRDTVEPQRNGFLVEKQNPRQLAKAIDTLLSDKRLRRRMGQESRKIAERDYDIHSVVDKHLEIYNSLL